jgi:hypothetical protein
MLILEYPSDIHEQVNSSVAELFHQGTKNAEEICSGGGDHFAWMTATNKSFRLSNPLRKFIPDFAICHNVGGSTQPYLLVEVSWSQSFKDVTEKIQTYFEFNSLVLAIIIDIQEKPRYHHPPVDELVDISRSEWESLGKKHPEISDVPISLGGLTWVNRTSCTLYIYSRDAGESTGCGGLAYEEVCTYFFMLRL